MAELLAEPQRTYPVIHVAGTNGKTHLAHGTRADQHGCAPAGTPARTCGWPPSASASTAHRSVPRLRGGLQGHRTLRLHGGFAQHCRMSKFEVLTEWPSPPSPTLGGAAVWRWARGSWDTNVADAKVSVICPVAMDHADYLGDDLESIGREKAGVIARFDRRRGEHDRRQRKPSTSASPRWTPRWPGKGRVQCCPHDRGRGQMLSCRELGGVYDEIFLPLHGRTRPATPPWPWPRRRRSWARARTQVTEDVVREAFASVITPGRLERVRSAPAMLVDAAHNPHGARRWRSAQLRVLLRKLVAVVGVLGDRTRRASSVRWSQWWTKWSSHKPSPRAVNQTSWPHRQGRRRRTDRRRAPVGRRGGHRGPAGGEPPAPGPGFRRRCGDHRFCRDRWGSPCPVGEPA